MLNSDDLNRASTLKVEIDLGGAAFHEDCGGDFPGEVARILRDVATGVEEGRWLRTSDPDVLRRPLRDVNGNTVGVVLFTRDPQEG